MEEIGADNSSSWQAEPYISIYHSNRIHFSLKIKAQYSSEKRSKKQTQEKRNSTDSTDVHH